MTQQLEYIEHMVELLANKGLTPTIHIHDVHDNQIENYYAAAEPPQTAHHGRLSLFITDEAKLNTFISDLSVCESTADTIKSVTLRAYPIGETAALVKKYNFRMVERIVNGNASDDDGGVDEPNNRGQQTGGGNVMPTEVTYTFKYHDDTEDSRVGLPGAAVDAPEPDSGYRWNESVPTVFGNSNRTFTEVAVAQGGGNQQQGGGTGNTGGGAETYTATIHIGSSYVTRTGAAGSPLDLPALESGYTWPSNMPTVMPAMDFTAYAIEGEQDTSSEYTLTIQHEGETIRTEQLHADDIVFLGTAPEGYKWTNTPRYSKMPARNWTISTAEV